MSKEYKPNHCVNCNKPIRVLDAVRGVMRYIPTDDYTEIQFELTDGSFTRVPFCKKCNEKFEDKQMKDCSDRLIPWWNKKVKLKTMIRRLNSAKALNFYAEALQKRMAKRGNIQK